MRSLAGLVSAWSAAVLVCSVAGAAPAEQRERPAPLGARQFDVGGLIEGANIGMRLTNLGAFAFDMATFSPPGIEFPLHSGNSVTFASGLWMGAIVGGSPRVTVSEYVSEYGPGTAAGGIPENPNLEGLRVFHLFRQYPDAPSRDAALLDYQQEAVPRGAPIVSVQGDGTLSIPGNQMTFSVFNDLDHALHQSELGSTNPLQVEVRHTSWTYQRPAPLGQTVIMSFLIQNRGPVTLNGMHLSLWMDPDVGGFADDLTGCDTTRGLAFAYNATNSDLVYGSSSPAVGFDLLQGPLDEVAGQRLPMTAFSSYTNGGEPGGASESYNLMFGLTREGNTIPDPFLQSGKYMHWGDPVGGTGWLDPIASDKRFLMSAGPIILSPNELQELVVAVMVARGADRLASVALLKQYSDQVQHAFDHGQLPVLATPSGAPPPRLVVSGIRPNPGRGHGSIALSLASESDVLLEVLDLAGRRIASQLLYAMPAGPHHMPPPEAPMKLTPGIYLVRVSAGAESHVTRWVVLE
jgi:hypothetical protein